MIARIDRQPFLRAAWRRLITAAGERGGKARSGWVHAPADGIPKKRLSLDPLVSTAVCDRYHTASTSPWSSSPCRSTACSSLPPAAETRRSRRGECTFGIASAEEECCGQGPPGRQAARGGPGDEGGAQRASLRPHPYSLAPDATWPRAASDSLGVAQRASRCTPRPPRGDNSHWSRYSAVPLQAASFK